MYINILRHSGKASRTVGAKAGGQARSYYLPSLLAASVLISLFLSGGVPVVIGSDSKAVSESSMHDEISVSRKATLADEELAALTREVDGSTVLSYLLLGLADFINDAPHRTSKLGNDQSGPSTSSIALLELNVGKTGDVRLKGLAATHKGIDALLKRLQESSFLKQVKFLQAHGKKTGIVFTLTGQLANPHQPSPSDKKVLERGAERLGYDSETTKALVNRLDNLDRKGVPAPRQTKQPSDSLQARSMDERRYLESLRRLNQLKQIVPDKARLPQFVFAIEKAAEESGIKVVAREQLPTVEGPYWHTLPIKLDVKGEFSMVVRFVRRALDIPDRLTTITLVFLQVKGEDSGNRLADGAAVSLGLSDAPVEAKLVVQAYYWARPQRSGEETSGR
jgi:hypothetical protein